MEIAVPHCDFFFGQNMSLDQPMLSYAPTILMKILVDIHRTIFFYDVSWVMLVSLNHVYTIDHLCGKRKKKVELNRIA